MTIRGDDLDGAQPCCPGCRVLMRTALGCDVCPACGHEVAHDEVLLQALHACRATVMISGYDSDLYTRELADWQRIDLTGARDSRGARRGEVIWSNRPIGNHLFTTTGGGDVCLTVSS